MGADEETVENIDDEDDVKGAAIQLILDMTRAKAAAEAEAARVAAEEKAAAVAEAARVAAEEKAAAEAEAARVAAEEKAAAEAEAARVAAEEKAAAEVEAARVAAEERAAAEVEAARVAAEEKAAADAHATLRAQLTEMKIKMLKRRARELGAEESVIEDLDDEDDVKSATIELIIRMMPVEEGVPPAY
eukprot:COSAG01_NODE_9537_length_2415_cov_7.246978_2_plen_189_part_00